MGTFSNPKLRRNMLWFVGLPLVLCDERGISTLVSVFGKLELGSMSFTNGEELMAMEVVV